MTTFKIGDRVRSKWKNDESFGHIGTIIRINSINIEIKFDDFKGWQKYNKNSQPHWLVYPPDLELIKPPKPKASQEAVAKQEVWFVNCDTCQEQGFDGPYNSFSKAKQVAEELSRVQTPYKRKYYISKAVGYVEAVPQPTTRYVEL